MPVLANIVRLDFCRGILKPVAMVVTTALLMSSSVGALAEEPDYEGVSIQLWSVKEEVTADVRGTLKSLAGMGFDGVELAGDLGDFANDPEGFKAYLDKLGMTISAAHVGVDQFSEENFDKTIKFYQALDVDQLIVPMDARAWDPEQIDSLVADLNRIAESLEPYDMQTGYHNHHREFDTYKDSTFFDYIARNTPDNVLLQVDVGWAYFAGQDPAEILTRYRDRIKTVHFKAQMTRYADIRQQAEEAAKEHPFGEFGVIFQHNQAAADNHETIQPLIGQDRLDWPSIINALDSAEEPVWFVVEQEIYPKNMDPMTAVETSMNGLKAELSQ